MAGAEAGQIALMVLSWKLTGSATQASLILFASVVGRTAGAPLAGWIGDRYPRRIVMLTSELLLGLTLASMALATTFWMLFALAVVTSFIGLTNGAALDAGIASLVPDRDLARANATMGIGRTIGHMVGPVLAGVLIGAFGVRSAFLLDGLTSWIAACAVLAIAGDLGRGGAGRAPGSADGSSNGGALEGLRVIAEDPVLRLMVAGWCAMCVCFGFVMAAELPLSIAFGMDARGLAAIATCWCAGSLVGATLCRRVGIQRRGASVLVGVALACAIAFGGTSIAPSFAVVLTLMAFGGAAMAMGDVVEATLVQLRTDDAVRARTMAAYQGITSAVWGANLALSGLVVEATSARVAYAWAGLWCLVAAVGFGLVVRAMRTELVVRDLRSIRPRHALESELAEGA